MAPLELTLEELKKYDGSNKSLPIYLAIKGTVFDVTKGPKSHSFMLSMTRRAGIFIFGSDAACAGVSDATNEYEEEEKWGHLI